MFVMISNGYGLFDEIETLIELLQSRWSIEEIHNLFETGLNNQINLTPGTRKYSVARNAWLRTFLGIKRVNSTHSETDAFIKWICEKGYARKVDFERYQL